MLCKYCGKDFKSSHSLYAHIGASHKQERFVDFMSSMVKIGGDELDITNLELSILRSHHNNRCDICGKIETANTRPDCKNTPNKLCVDHNHNTKQFRGFICVQCNRNMGWLDKYQNQIEKYNNPYKSKVKK